MITEQEYLYWLVRVPGVGPASVFHLQKALGSFREVWKAAQRADAAAFEAPLKGNERRREQLFAAAKLFDERRREMAALSGRKVRLVTFLDADYPKRLSPLPDKPPVLFVKGKLPLEDAPAAAIVGARDCSEYGRWAASSFAEILAGEGVQIISGLAMGVDGAAHRGALQAGKKAAMEAEKAAGDDAGGAPEVGMTFGVLGCGIHTCYPRENYDLYREMEQRGGILTEFPPEAKPEAGNFPRRNRIISGLADAVLIIEAKEKSGSLITADLALEQGKEVFALPGRITDPLSGGCNRLLQMGAALCLSPSDVLEAFGIRRDKKLTVHKISEKRLENREKVLYSFLDSRPKHVEEIMAGCGLRVTECMEILLKLELLGLVRACGNQYYCRKL